VDLVYCWHALLGYWSGVHPPDPSTPQDAGLAGLGIAVQTPVPTRGSLQVEPRLSWDALTLKGVGISAPERMDEFYERLHSYLRACSVDGVKVDVQAAATMLGAGRGGSAAASREAVQAMERSVVRNFGGENCINCMCHPLECLYAYKDTCVARASEDFYPRDPASHTLHVANVVYNSLFLGEIVIPDWDMFQSNIAVSTLHAVARAVGGCSVYVSDRPGEHDFSLLRRVVMPDGSVLRALQPGKPTRDCLFCDVTTDGTTGEMMNEKICLLARSPCLSCLPMSLSCSRSSS
jgi:raffinose synthase